MPVLNLREGMQPAIELESSFLQKVNLKAGTETVYKKDRVSVFSFLDFLPCSAYH